LKALPESTRIIQVKEGDFLPAQTLCNISKRLTRSAFWVKGNRRAAVRANNHVFILAFQVLFYPAEVPESSYLWRWGILSVSTEGLYTAGIERGFKNAIAAADRVLVVTNPEVSAVRDADRVIGILEAEEKGPGALIFNR